MNSGWRTVSLDVAPLEIVDGDRGNAYPRHSDFTDAGHCLFLNASNVTSAGFDFSTCQFVSEQKDAELRKGKLRRQDVILTTRGTLGNSALYSDSVPFDHVRINSGMVVFRVVQNALIPEFLFNFLRSPNFNQQVRQLQSGVAQPQLPIRDMKKIRMPLPPIAVQQRIVFLTSAYDDLIENNRRRIRLLEEAARLIYREWFVRLRFPGHEHTKMVDGVPDGWTKATLGGVSTVVMGQSPESKHYNEEGLGLPFHQGVRDFGLRFPTTRVYCSGPGRIAEEGDILVSVRAPVGRLNIAPTKMVIGRGLSAIRAKVGNQSLLFHQLRGFFFKEDRIGSGAIYAAVTRAELEGVEMLVPSDGVASAFEETVSPIERQIQVLDQAVVKLQAARDLLLPRLMSGEVEV